MAVDEFEIENGHIIIIDPCYKIDDGFIVKAKNGKWICEIHYSDEGSFGRRISELFATHVDHLHESLHAEFIGVMGVDSGQGGIFDTNYYINDKVYNEICELTLSKRGFGTVKNGCASSSGYGDGSYPVYVAKDGDEAINVRIFFIEDEEEDEY